MISTRMMIVMMNSNLNRRVFETWDEAFKALAPVVRQQSVRVAAYTQVLFVQACASDFGSNSEEGKVRIQGKNADLAYKCALYHQIGKALVPREYQVWHKDFTEEEQALYRKYTTDGRILVSKLQERSIKNKSVSTDFEEEATDNLAWLMIRESCQQHMERWEGGGYPEGRIGNQISPIAQIVGLAKELDRLTTSVKSEQPFEDAMIQVIAQSEKGFSKELIDILQACRGKLKTVYRTYIQYTKTLPKTVPLVEKRKERPMGLLYRPMIRGLDGYVAAYEAVPWFKGSLENAGETETLKDLEGLLDRTNLTDDMTFYFLYEASDMVLRLQNCKLPFEAVLVPNVEKFYTSGNKMQRLTQLYTDQPIDKRLLHLLIPQSVVANMTQQTSEFIKLMIDDGIPLVVDNYNPEFMPMEELMNLGIYNVRFDSNLYLSVEIANVMTVMKNNGFQIVGGNADSHDVIHWLDACGATFMSGTLTGELTDEETIVKELLAKDQVDG